MKIDRPDWVIHAVTADDCESDGYIVNYHTHGLVEYDLPELMISLPIVAGHAYGLINSIGLKAVNEHIRFEGGKKYSGFLAEGYHIKTVAYSTPHGDVMLIILPDSEDRFSGDDGCDTAYSGQAEMAEAFISGLRA